MPRFFLASAVVALLGLVPPSVAQSTTQARLDAATFRYTDDESLVEVYLSLGAKTLPFVGAEGGFQASVPVHVRLAPVTEGSPSGASASAAFDETVPLTYVIADTSALNDTQVFVEQIRMTALPGEYTLDVTLQPVGAPEVRLVRDLTVPDYVGTAGTSFSAVQLATDIQRAEASGPLTKSGLTIRPNPDAFYGGAGAAVQYYAEVYGPPTSGDQYTLLAFVAESERGVALPDHERRMNRAVRPVDVAVGQLGVDTLPSGIYYLRLVVLNEANEAVADQSKRFYVINPDVERPQVGPGMMSYEETLFAAMGEEELDLNVRHARVIANGREASQIGQLQTDDDRRRFLTTFWTARDTDGIAGINDARRMFYERLPLVNERFSELGTPGYETDRGRVYLKYGPPTEVDRHPFDTGLHPYEIWNYDSIPGEGRAIFVFVDRFESNRFELVHSDVTGEVSLPSWERELAR